MPFTNVPTPPPPDRPDSWLRYASDVLPSLQWRAVQGDLGRWYTPAGEPVQLLKTTSPDGTEMIGLAPGQQPERLDLLLTEHTAKVAQHGTLSAKPSTKITYAGTAYGFRIVCRDGVTELAAMAV